MWHRAGPSYFFIIIFFFQAKRLRCAVSGTTILKYDLDCQAEMGAGSHITYFLLHVRLK